MVDTLHLLYGNAKLFCRIVETVVGRGSYFVEDKIGLVSSNEIDAGGIILGSEF